MNLVSKKNVLFAGFCLFFFSLLVAVEISNGKFWTNDLKVYYGAVNQYFKGNNPYEHYFGLKSGYFKYPPTVLYLMYWMRGFSYQTVQIVHSILLLISLVVSIFVINGLLVKMFNKLHGARFLYFCFAVIAIHVVREVHLGNLNLMLLCVLSISMYLYYHGKENISVFLAAIAIIFKPFLLLTVVPYVIYGNINLFWKLGILGTLFFFIPIMWGDFFLWKEWLKSIAEHGDYIVSENSLTYLTQYYLGIRSQWMPSLLVLLVVFGFLIYDCRHNENRTRSRLIIWSMIFLALTPNLFVTDTEHFLLSLPMIAVLIITLFNQRKILSWITFGLFIFCFSMNSNDLLKSYSAYLDEWGVLGLSNLGMIAMLIFYVLKNKHIRISSTSAIQ